MAPAPLPPWTRGGTLLPSRGEAKEEEEGGGLSPPRFRWHRSAAGAIIITAIYTNTSAIFTNISITFTPLYSGPLSCNPLYPLLEHGALCFILLLNDVLPSYDV